MLIEDVASSAEFDGGGFDDGGCGCGYTRRVKQEDGRGGRVVNLRWGEGVIPGCVLGGMGRAV